MDVFSVYMAKASKDFAGHSQEFANIFLSLVFLLMSRLTNGLRLHHFLGTKTTEANKSLKTDANGAH